MFNSCFEDIIIRNKLENKMSFTIIHVHTALTILEFILNLREEDIRCIKNKNKCKILLQNFKTCSKPKSL